MSKEFTTTTVIPVIFEEKDSSSSSSSLEKSQNKKKSISSQSSEKSQNKKKSNSSQSSEKSQNKKKSISSQSSEKSQNKKKSISSQSSEKSQKKEKSNSSKSSEKSKKGENAGSEESNSEKKKKKIRSAAARDAFQDKDVYQSIQVHTTQSVAKEKHRKGADYIKSVVYGGMDGIGTALAVVTSAAGAKLGTPVILALGISTLIADGVGMGVSDFISGKAENDYSKGELKRETWEYDNYPEGEIAEMVELYTQKGLAEEEAKELVRVLSLNKNNFIDTMMTVELGLMPPDPEDSPSKQGLVTFASFIIFGIVPLLSFIFGAIDNKSSFNTLFGISCGLTAIVLFLLGAITSRFSVYAWWKTGLVMLLVGAISSAASYGIGALINFVVTEVGGVVCGENVLSTTGNNTIT